MSFSESIDAPNIQVTSGIERGQNEFVRVDCGNCGRCALVWAMNIGDPEKVAGDLQYARLCPTTVSAAVTELTAQAETGR